MQDFFKKYSSGAWFGLLTFLFVVISVVFYVYITQEPWVYLGLAVAFMSLLYLKYRETLVLPLRYLSREIDLFADGKRGKQEIEIDGYQYDLKRVLSFFNASIKALYSIKHDFLSGKQLQSDVDLASQIQGALLDKTHLNTSDIEIVARTKGASKINGDSYDIIQQKNNYYIYLGDVTGHGVASGFVMMMVNALIVSISRILKRSDHIIVDTNRILTPRIPRAMMMTLLMLRWDEKQKRMFYSGGGHEYIIIYHSATNTCTRIKSGGVAIGMKENISQHIEEKEIDIHPGDIIVMYSDGVSEARSRLGNDTKRFKIDGIMNSIKKSQIKTAQGVFNQITRDLSRFMGREPYQHDDATLVCVHYGVPDPEAPKEIPSSEMYVWDWESGDE